MPVADPRLPATVLTGFPGAGKTTLLRHWLARKPEAESWAVLVNDIGALGLAAPTLAGAAAVQIAGGCACCTGQLAFGVALNRLLRAGRRDRLFIELSGLGHPGRLVDLLSSGSIEKSLRIDEVVALVDATQIERLLCGPQAVLARAQIEAADRLVLNRAGEIPAASLARLSARLREFPPFARELECSRDGAATLPDGRHRAPPCEPRLSGSGSGPGSETASAQATGSDAADRPAVANLAWRWPAERRFERACLLGLAGQWRQFPGLLRGKAVFRTLRDWYCWQFDGERATWETSGWRRDSRIELLVEGGHRNTETVMVQVETGLAEALGLEIARTGSIFIAS